MNARGMLWTCAALSLAALGDEAQGLSVRTLPATVYVERGRTGQQLDVDLAVTNRGATPVELEELEATVLGPDGSATFRHHVGANGGSIEVIPERLIPPGGELLVYNPLHTYDDALPLTRVRFTLTFSRGDATETVTTEVSPRRYTQRTALTLPMKGRLLVHDGHDFHGHHRRFPLLSDKAKLLGLTFNPTRTALDLVVVDRDAAMFKGDGTRNEDWYSFGAPVFAPGAGVVVAVVNDLADGALPQRPPLDKEQVLANPAVLMGNHVVIDHGHGEFSQLAHLRQGSIRVRVGQRVAAGERLGEIGYSGDALFPHLHYQLQTGPGLAEGLPAVWRDFRRHTGASPLRVRQGAVDSGDVVER